MIQLYKNFRHRQVISSKNLFSLRYFKIYLLFDVLKINHLSIKIHLSFMQQCHVCDIVMRKKKLLTVPTNAAIFPQDSTS